MTGSGKRNFGSFFLFMLGAACATVVAVAIGIGLFAGVRMGNHSQSTQLQELISLKAGTASRSDSLSIATGQIDGEVEGLYVLDHVSGNLQCWILSATTGEVAGIFRANVTEDLEADKSGDPEYLLVTGSYFYSGGKRGNESPAASVVYVADGATGNVVGYGLTFDRQALRRGNPQEGILNKVCSGSARDVVTRDQ